MSKAVADRDPVLFIIAVADLRPLGIDFLNALAEGLVRRHVFVPEGPGLRQFAGRVLLAEQKLCRRESAVLSGKTHVKDRVHLVVERNFHCAAAEKHDDDFLSGFAHLVNELQMALREPHVFAVASLGFIEVGEPRKD